MAAKLEIQAVRCVKCRRYLCGLIGLVEIKCPSCKTLNKVTAGDVGELAERTGYGTDGPREARPDTGEKPARRKNAGSGTEGKRAGDHESERREADR